MKEIIKSHDPKKCENGKGLILFQLNKELIRDGKVLENFSFGVMKQKETIEKIESLKELYENSKKSGKIKFDEIKCIEGIEIRIINTSNKRKERNEIRYYFKEV